MKGFIAGLVTLLLAACSSTDDGTSIDSGSNGEAWLTSADGMLEANLRRTKNGVPHITADTLESAAFGAGMVQAQDNICQLAESFLKVRSERSLYFGPGEDNANIISDFSYKALHLLSSATTDLAQLSPQSKALVYGFVAGYNQYVTNTSAANLPSQCRNQPWVVPVSAAELLAHYRLIAQYASGDLFASGLLFMAVPPGVSVEPVPVDCTINSRRSNSAGHDSDSSADMSTSGAIAEDALRSIAAMVNLADTGLASNAWGIGSELSEQGRGALLANPHVPYTGARRLYQMHMTVPGFLDINGAGLLGTAVPLIGFNQNLAWSHTVSTSVRFTAYELTLKEDDDLTYIKDGLEVPMSAETMEIQVANGTSTPTRLQRDFYFSEYGPMIPAELFSAGAIGAWGVDRKAYTYRDANSNMSNVLDTWLRMNKATNLEEFQQVFQDCGTTLWTNTIYADDQGNAWYIDSSSVPHLSEEALQVIQDKRQASATYDTFFRDGLVLLDGNTSRDDWIEGACSGRVPYESKPQLLRSDFVQNSNDSYWSTNPAAPIQDISPLFGPEGSQLSARTRLGLTMLQRPADADLADTPPAGQDGKFSAEDLVKTIYNNRSWYAETLLAELLSRCELIGSNPVNAGTDDNPTVENACSSLAGWNGTFDLDSSGAPLFRLFMAQYIDQLDSELVVAFDAIDPVGTPSTPSTAARGTANDAMLSALARAVVIASDTGVAMDATLGSVQVFQRSGGVPPGGEPQLQGDAIPWHGAMSYNDGGFNAIGVVRSQVAEDTRFPRISHDTVPGSAGLSVVPGTYWQIGRGTSWHFGVEFTDSGPEAYGLLSYAQSTDDRSPYFDDQSLRYSQKDYRPLLFTDADISANVLPDGESVIQGVSLLSANSSD